MGGERGVQQTAKTLGIGDGRIVGVRAVHGSLDPQPGDLDAATGGPSKRAGRQAQVRQAGRMRSGERLRRLGDERGSACGFQRSRGKQIIERVSADPFEYHVRPVTDIFDVENLREP